MRDRPSWDEYFLHLARVVAERSPDEETQVGCVVVDEGHRLLTCGYNGFPPGFPDYELPATRPEKYPFMVHAEINAIASTRQDLRRSILYTTHSPCVECAKAVITSGVARVVCAQVYQNADIAQVVRLFKFAGIPLEHWIEADRRIQQLL